MSVPSNSSLKASTQSVPTWRIGVPPISISCRVDASPVEKMGPGVPSWAWRRRRRITHRGPSTISPPGKNSLSADITTGSHWISLDPPEQRLGCKVLCEFHCIVITELSEIWILLPMVTRSWSTVRHVVLSSHTRRTWGPSTRWSSIGNMTWMCSSRGPSASYGVTTISMCPLSR
uniref:Uncharacterized protein n=1 Tax=Cacopsylla melanoneura TaxID=428564 RepID=A0A8D9ESL0_9HEMI